jgi:hypothetical protein
MGVNRFETEMKLKYTVVLGRNGVICGVFKILNDLRI